MHDEEKSGYAAQITPAGLRGWRDPGPLRVGLRMDDPHQARDPRLRVDGEVPGRVGRQQAAGLVGATATWPRACWPAIARGFPQARVRIRDGNPWLRSPLGPAVAMCRARP